MADFKLNRPLNQKWNTMSRTTNYLIIAISIIVLFVGFAASEIRFLGIGASILIFPMILSFAYKYKTKNLEENGKEFQEKPEQANIRSQKIGKVANAMINYGLTELFFGAILLRFVLMVVTTL
jgi:hypothetical protein